jgi:hypothetical protein
LFLTIFSCSLNDVPLRVLIRRRASSRLSSGLLSLLLLHAGPEGGMTTTNFFSFWIVHLMSHTVCRCSTTYRRIPLYTYLLPSDVVSICMSSVRQRRRRRILSDRSIIVLQTYLAWTMSTFIRLLLVYDMLLFRLATVLVLRRQQLLSPSFSLSSYHAPCRRDYRSTVHFFLIMLSRLPFICSNGSESDIIILSIKI